MAWIHHQRAHAPVKPCRETIETSGVALGVRPPAAGTPPSAPPIGPQQVQAFVTARNRARWRRARLTQRGVQRADLPKLLLASSRVLLVCARLEEITSICGAVRVRLCAPPPPSPPAMAVCTDLDDRGASRPARARAFSVSRRRRRAATRKLLPTAAARALLRGCSRRARHPRVARARGGGSGWCVTLRVCGRGAACGGVRGGVWHHG